jgi:hypothetical protein
LKAGGLSLVAPSTGGAATTDPAGGAATASAATSDAAPQSPVQATERPEAPRSASAAPQTQTATGPSSAATSGSAAGVAVAAAAGAETGDTLDAIQQAIGYANSVGVTSVGVTARTPDDLLPYDTLLRTRELTARVNAALMAEWPLDEAAVARLDALRKRYEGVPLFKLKAVRLAVKYEPAPDPPKPAKPLSDEKRQAAYDARVKALSQSIALLEQHDWQIILETPDYDSAQLALNAIKAGLPSTPEPGTPATRSPKRFVRLEANQLPPGPTPLADVHVMPAARKPAPAELLPFPLRAAATAADAATEARDAAAAARAAELGIKEKPMLAEELAQFEVLSRPYASIERKQPVFMLFSAWPLTPLDPRVALKEIMLDGLKLAGSAVPDASALTARLARAIDASTRYAALASGELDQQGTIKKEMLADLVIFSADLFALPPDKLMDAEVTTTIFDGKVIYTRPEPTADTSSQ